MAGLLTGGCATGGYTYVKKISTGERIEFPLVRGMPEPAKSGAITIAAATLIPDQKEDKKQAVYLFAMLDESPQPPKSVRIEDVSDDIARVLLEDPNPTLNKHRWVGHSREFTGNDAELNWVTYLDDSLRVFRFTITSASGEKIVLHQGWMVPAMMKAAMRKTLDIK